MLHYCDKDPLTDMVPGPVVSVGDKRLNNNLHFSKKQKVCNAREMEQLSSIQVSQTTLGSSLGNIKVLGRLNPVSRSCRFTTLQ